MRRRDDADPKEAVDGGKDLKCTRGVTRLSTRELGGKFRPRKARAGKEERERETHKSDSSRVEPPKHAPRYPACSPLQVKR